MRLQEFIKSVDVEEIMFYEAEKFFNEHPDKRKLLESSDDYDEYRNSINSEKSETIAIRNLIKGDSYVPLSIYGTPIGKYIQFFTTDTKVEFIKNTGHKLQFTNKIKNIEFPCRDYGIGDTCIDILIFSSIYERDQFLTIQTLKFGDWKIVTKYL